MKYFCENVIFLQINEFTQSFFIYLDTFKVLSCIHFHIFSSPIIFKDSLSLSLFHGHHQFVAQFDVILRDAEAKLGLSKWWMTLFDIHSGENILPYFKWIYPFCNGNEAKCAQSILLVRTFFSEKILEPSNEKRFTTRPNRSSKCDGRLFRCSWKLLTWFYGMKQCFIVSMLEAIQGMKREKVIHQICGHSNGT